MKEKNKQIAMGIVVFVLVLALTLQFRSMRKQSIQNGDFASSSLKDSLLNWKEKYENAKKEADKSDEELAQIRSEKVSDNTEKSAELDKYNTLLGLTDVKGEGIVITAKDGQISSSASSAGTDDISSMLVHDADLREIVGELENAGAEAISINDKRIVNTTSIECARKYYINKWRTSKLTI